MITYNDIYEAERKEKYSRELQNLPKNFVSEVSAYLKEKKDISSKEDDNFSDIIIKTKKQLENAITLFNGLMRLRRKKILGLILIAAETGISKKDFDNMLQFEKELFEELMKCIDSSNKKMGETLKGEAAAEQKNDMVMFLADVDSFLGLDGEMTGPFNKGDVANLPKEIVKILLDDGKVKIIEK